MRANDKPEKKRLGISPLKLAAVLLTALAAVVCVICAVSAMSGEQMPMPLGFGTSVVLSGSMEPALSVNDVIIVRRSGSYGVGDIVVYRSGQSSVVHRIVSVNGSEVVTKGDANNSADKPIRLSDVRGKVVGRIPKAGAVVGFMQSTAGALIILTAAVLLMWFSFRSGDDGGRQEKEKLTAEIESLRAGSEKTDG